MVSIDNPRVNGLYANHLDDTQTFSSPGAAALRVHFTTIDTETDPTCVDGTCDNIYLTDASGDLYQILSGHQTDVLSVAIPGDTVDIRLVTDANTPFSGYHVDRIDVLGNDTSTTSSSTSSSSAATTSASSTSSTSAGTGGAGTGGAGTGGAMTGTGGAGGSTTSTTSGTTASSTSSTVSSSASGASTTGTGGEGGSQTKGNDPGENGGCGCRTAGSAPEGANALWISMGALATVLSARRRRRR
jgi:cobalamin biosynthesis Mg chelatase CobN